MTVRTLLYGGQVADGTGAALARADVLVSGDRVVGIGKYDPSDADVTLDCTGLIVAPGFIDIHTHSDLSRFAYPEADSRVLQGITTEVIGNCGLGPAPIRGNADDVRAVIGPIDIIAEVELPWNSVAEYFAALDATPAATNVAALIGHGTLLVGATEEFGADPARAQDRLARMIEELGDAFAAGAWGLSFGLMYSPGELSTVAELTELSSFVARNGGLVSMHLRAYDGERLDAAIREALEIAEDSGVRFQISHLRSIQDDGSALSAALEMLDKSTLDVEADAYPYLAGHTTMLQLLPSELRALPVPEIAERLQSDPVAAARMIETSAGFAPELITIAKAPRTPDAVGNTVTALVEGSGHTSWGDFAVELLIANDLSVDVIVVGTRPEDALRVLQHPLVSVASDGLALSLGHDANLPHPRSIGTFPRSLNELLRSGMDVATIVHKMTAKPAARLGLVDRGTLVQGGFADITVFDATTVADQATYAEPLVAPTGIHHVLVNGVAVVRDGVHTTELPGLLLRRRTA